MKPSELIARYGWVQGRDVGYDRGFCLDWALLLSACEAMNHEAVYYAHRVILQTRLGVVNLACWNDAPERMIDEVLAVLREVGL